MAFEVTATRRRPQQFEDLVGQEFVAETLKNSITSKQIAHAYLFSGPRGCGKTSTARILAKALNCESGPTATPCGVCAHCKEITVGSSLDVIEIDGASNTSVNDVRQIKDEVLFPPNASRYKIYIIDEVHMLSTSAFNALLKTIEEPPPYVVFIFATTELQKVPATIKSRCQQFTFRLVSVEKIKQLLAAAAAELNMQADDEALYWIARESTGSVRDAYTLFDQVAAFSDGIITYEKIRDKLGLVGIDKLNELFEMCADGKSDDALSVLDDYLQSGVSIEQLIANSTNYIRSLLLIKNGITKEALLGNSPERYSQNVIAAWNTVQVERALSIFLQLYRDMRYSLSPRYELELAFSRLCWLSQYVSPAEVKLAIDNARALLGNGNAHGNMMGDATNDTTGTTQFPTGMPRFSALSQSNLQSSAEQPIEAHDAMQHVVQSETQTTCPFHNGGAEPPEQTAANQWDADEWDDNGAPDDYQDDGYMPSKLRQNAFTHQQASSGKNVEESWQAQLYTTSDGRTITGAQLRGAVIAELSINDAMTASALMQTGAWNISDSAITTTIETAYQKARLEQQKKAIEYLFEKICGRPLAFIINLKETMLPEQNTDLPQQVKIVQSIFKGSIVGGKG